jgi:hypothetical protein
VIDFAKIKNSGDQFVRSFAKADFMVFFSGSLDLEIKKKNCLLKYLKIQNGGEIQDGRQTIWRFYEFFFK